MNTHCSHFCVGSTRSGSRKYTSSQHHMRSPNATTSANHSRGRESDDHTSNSPCVEDLTPGALMLAAAASAGTTSSQLAAAAAAAAASVVPNTELAAAAHAAAGLVAQGASAVGQCPVANAPSTMGVSSSAAAAAAAHEMRLNARASVESYEAEMMKAEKAAAALLAEIDEEEQAAKTKKSKKKKKKQRQHAKRAEEQKKLSQATGEKNGEEEEEALSQPPPTTVEKDSPPSRAEKEVDKNHSNLVENTTTTTAAATTATVETTTSTEKPEEMLEKPEINQETAPAEKDPLEREYEVLVENENTEGLEELLSSIRGVPGRAILRKNIKKALKRLRVANEEAAAEDKMEDATAVLPVEVTPSQEQRPSSPENAPLEPLQQQVIRTTPQNGEPHPGTVTPPVAQSPRVSELVAIVSQNHNKTNSNSRLPKGHPGAPKSECIMHMAPLIVGWVIGKGGQRIRDLMEESGARIWIDQDSMGPQEPRIVFVSGQRSNVDTAVRMIADLISKAPTDTPNSKQSLTPGTPAVISGDLMAPVSPTNLSKVPGLPLSTGAVESGTFQLKPREKKKSCEFKAWREMTCDPRFVPLLIGRRGWTIKNIQDSSGARVDIDQNVTPRKITISGSDSAVEIAARMVGDVLSYPHSLLHGATEGMDLFPAGEPALEAQEDVDEIIRRNNEGLDRVSLERPASPYDMQKSRSHNSPPSSLIMTGDGKSTISATSSLSSTPEPFSNSNPSVATNAPLLSPAYEQQHSHPLQNSFGCFPPAIARIDNSALPGISPQDPVALRLARGPQAVPMMHNAGYVHNHGIASTGQLGAGPPPPPPPPLSQLPPRSFEHQPPPVPFSSAPSANAQQNPMPLHPQNGFSSGLPPLATPESHRSLVHSPVQPPPQQQPQGMWDAEPQNSAGDGFGLAAAVDFLQYNQEGGHLVRSGSLPQPSMNEIMGLPLSPSAPSPTGLGALGLERHTSAPLTAGGTGGKDESNIVDSLFGSCSDPRNDAALVSGLRGLSLDPPLSNTPGMDPWGRGTGAGFDLPPTYSTMHGLSFGLHPHNPAPVGPSLFSTTTTAPYDRQHSRFSWGGSE